MATLQAHGKEIGRIEYKIETRAYFEDGYILVNNGFGWKILGKVKSTITPQNHYAKMLKQHNLWLDNHPLSAKFINCLHDIAGIKDRWKLCQAIQLMPDDPDGVWSEVCDSYGDNLSASIEDIAELCRLYRNVIAADEGRKA